MKNREIVSNDLRITYNDITGLPKGIRDNTGYLLFFREITRYPDQEQRYDEESQNLHKLAEFILKSTKNLGKNSRAIWKLT